MLLVVMYIFIFHISPSIQAQWYKNISEGCLVNCDSDMCTNVINQTRGTNYYLNGDKGAHCKMTAWEVSHFIFHAVLGYFFPPWVSFGLSATTEVFEYYRYDCGSWLDLGWNFGGLITGIGMRGLTGKKIEGFCDV